jgi:DNA-binding Lrp family transcriptional regulator
VETPLIDAIDRQIIHILTIEPRASFRTVADVAGISDQTAARRYRRMAESAGLRVLGVPDGSRLGWTDWFLRLQTTPGGADSIAEALARRPDTRWVHLASGGTEIICTLQARTEEQRDALFLRGLPGSRRVVQITAHSILHDFTPGPWREATRALSPAQLEKLRHHAPQDLTARGSLLPEDEPAAERTGPRRPGQYRRAGRGDPLARIHGAAQDRRAPPVRPAGFRARHRQPGPRPERTTTPARPRRSASGWRRIAR